MLSPRFSRLFVAVIASMAMWGATVASPAAAQASACGHRGHSRITHVIVIAFENHSYAQVLGQHAPPSYFKTLAGRCGSATRFRAAHVPRSLPNYIAATSGRVTITGDCTPSRSCRSVSQNIFSQLGPKNWRVLAESMPGRCVAQNRGQYVPRHAPAIYYTRIHRSTCRRDMLPLAKTPRPPSAKFTWVAPNLMHDMHDGSLGQAATWLHHYLAGTHGLLRSRAYHSGHTAIFVWFDTGDGSSSVRTPIPLIVVSPHTPRRHFTKPITNYQLLRTWESVFHLPCINLACGAHNLKRTFHFR
jgi:phosphatidylinositol-3-phosphatase